MEAVSPFHQTPRFAITIPRPWTWLIATGIRRDWLIATDPGPLLGHAVAIHSASLGNVNGWRDFDRWTEGKVDRRAVVEQCPHRAIVGVAVVAGVDCLGRSWRVRFQQAQEVPAIGPVCPGDLELWGIPAHEREALHGHLAELRRRAALGVGGESGAPSTGP